MKPFFLTFSFVVSLILVSTSLKSQKVPLDHSIYDSWNSLKNPNISNDGAYISFELNPEIGDGDLVLYRTGFKPDTLPRGYQSKFLSDSKILVYKIKAEYDTLRKAEIAKLKKEELPKDSLGIYLIAMDSLIKFPELESFKIPEKNSDWIAFLNEEEIEVPVEDSINEDSTELKTIKYLQLLSLSQNKHFKFEDVSDYGFSKNGSAFSYIINKNDSIDSTYVHHIDLTNYKNHIAFKNKGECKKITLNNQGNSTAFIYSSDTTKEKNYQLLSWDHKTLTTSIILDTNDSRLRDNYSVSKNGDIFYSKNADRIFFGIAPSVEIEEKDSIPESEKPILDLWSWTDDRIQPQQLEELKDDKKKSYASCYNFKDKSLIQIEDSVIDSHRIFNKGNKNYAFGVSVVPYYRFITWDYPYYKDFYYVDLKTGKKQLLIKKKKSSFSFGPSGKYFVYYEEADSNWYSIDIKKGNKINITARLSQNLWDEDNDEPSDPFPYGLASWMENDNAILIYDRYDVWKVDLTGKASPINLTNGFGRKNNIELRYLRLNKEVEFLKNDTTILLKGFNEITKEEYLYTLNLYKINTPKLLLNSSHYYSSFTKAEESNKLIFTKESFNEFPELHYSDISFREISKISYTNPQQNNFLWGTVEITEWTNFYGENNKGLLYLPEDFDASKKYPLLVYFYDRHTDNLNRYFEPIPHRSTIRPAFYTSRGYVVFMPDIKYRDGYPGESCYNAVISGIKSISAKGFIDEEKIGVQGTSWGGYQISWLVTRTDIFKAAMAGSPVSNMTSAYGGVRWESGLSRSFQYEKGQSRIGQTLWDKPILYIENSPIFYVDKINTPLLIRHDDKDGAVPWYQGIELFLAMRRLDKPVWMLNYNDQPHNLLRRANKVDFAIRMQQFFDYYLKDEKMPEWMKNGIPAIEKGDNLGYDLLEND